MSFYCFIIIYGKQIPVIAFVHMIADSFSSFHEKDEKKNKELHGLYISQDSRNFFRFYVTVSPLCPLLRNLQQTNERKIFTITLLSFNFLNQESEIQISNYS
mmetsp:Transcript_22249/g.21487  ORF Transcript_22249/g.21487 Transcript_22249/m.21487 type:complete len:102 (-) Transcript_22249:126-431(-)